MVVVVFLLKVVVVVVEGRLIMCGVCEVGWREGCVVKGVSVGVGEIRGVTN